jgi:hypothetical protein
MMWPTAGVEHGPKVPTGQGPPMRAAGDRSSWDKQITQPQSRRTPGRAADAVGDRHPSSFAGLETSRDCRPGSRSPPGSRRWRTENLVAASRFQVTERCGVLLAPGRSSMVTEQRGSPTPARRCVTTSFSRRVRTSAMSADSARPTRR